MINYKVALILGSYAAVITILVVLFCMVLIPFVCWHAYKDNQRVNENARKREKLLQHLVVKDYDPVVFSLNIECSICLSDFEKGQKVCPLPCNKLHVFHHECILQWLK